MYRPWFICGQSLSHLIGMIEKRREKRKPYRVLSSKHMYMDIHSITSRIFFYTLLPLHPGTPGIPRGPTAPD